MIWRAVRAVLLAIAAVVIAIEEWGWRPLTAWAARLAQWPPLRRLEARIRAASPLVALLLFAVPALLLFPLKVAALWLVHGGHAAIGVAIIVLAKLLGTALVGRLFIITEPQLMRFAWFAHAVAWWRRTKQRVRAAIERSAAWQAVRRLHRHTSLWMRRRMRQSADRG